MKHVIGVQELEEMLRNRTHVRSQPWDALLTLSAPDFVRDCGSSGNHKGPMAERDRLLSASEPATAKGSSADLEAFFNSPPIHELKLQICDIGRRLWQRAYVDGNGGNIVIRVGENLALCTPASVSKGFMKPEDMCLVDMEGNQLAGTRKRTSEILMHLQIMKRQPRAVASVHGHPPYSTGFGVAGVEPPTGMVSEFELFVSAAIAPYRTPGTPELGQIVADLADKHNTILMANHGVVAWSHNNVEDAYFKIEILEAYCRTVLVGSQLGKPLKTMTPAQLQDLLRIKQSLGIPDPRFGLKECELRGTRE
jgi:L-fuculose-phosphate aldolase